MISNSPPTAEEPASPRSRAHARPGIANTAIFSVVNGVLLKPLPYEKPGQLVQVWEAPQPGKWNAVTPGAFTDWKEGSTSLEALSLVTAAVMNLAGEGQPERLSGLMVSASYLQCCAFNRCSVADFARRRQAWP
jgi:hypothetical protein